MREENTACLLLEAAVFPHQTVVIITASIMLRYSQDNTHLRYTCFGSETTNANVGPE